MQLRPRMAGTGETTAAKTSGLHAEIAPVFLDKDIGGPLKNGFVPPPLPGFGVDGKPIALPATTSKGVPIKTGAPPPTLVPQKVIRVQSATPP